MNLKIAFSGPAGTGKSTLLQDILNDNRMKKLVEDIGGFTHIEEPVRTLKRAHGIKINEFGTLDTELMVLSTHVLNSLTYPRLLTDRCIIDNVIYTHLSSDFEGKSDYLKAATIIRDNVIDNYDIIFYIRPEFEPPEDGTRDITSSFYQDSITAFDETYENLSKDHGNIIYLSGSRPERLEKIFKVIDDFIGEKE